MSPSRFLLATSSVLGLALAACGGGDDSCGPGGAPTVGLVAAGNATTMTFGSLTAGPNGDCPAADAPSGVTSLTVTGTQSDGTGFVTLCVARPDLLAKQSQTLSLERAGGQAFVVDVTGMASNCSYAIDRTQPATGTLSASGLCGNGADPAGFALVVDGSLTLQRTCGQTIDTIAATLRGRVAVTPE